MPNQREDSRRNWNSGSTIENINSGSLQRIADACELIAKDREKLEQECDWLRRNRDYYSAKAERLNRSNAALRGVITKLKKAVAATNAILGVGDE